MSADVEIIIYDKVMLFRPSKSYVNVYITLKEMLLISHEIMFISVN